MLKQLVALKIPAFASEDFLNKLLSLEFPLQTALEAYAGSYAVAHYYLAICGESVFELFCKS